MVDLLTGGVEHLQLLNHLAEGLAVAHVLKHIGLLFAASDEQVEPRGVC